MQLLNDMLSFIYPPVCCSCGKILKVDSLVLCFECRFSLPKTDFHKFKGNPIEKIFWGRVPIHRASSYYYFKKGGKVQNLIHMLKYKGQQKVGETIGHLMGDELKQNEDFKDVSYVIPVPLHPKKLKKRGYNQSDSFAIGLSDKLKVEPQLNQLVRTISTQTQTKKSRWDRWLNVESIFKLNEPEKFTGKHVLLVDDVITTGATIESCAQKLREVPDIKISIASIAFASNL